MVLTTLEKLLALPSTLDFQLINDPTILTTIEDILTNGGSDGQPDGVTNGSNTYDLNNSTSGQQLDSGQGADLILGSNFDDELKGERGNDVIVGNGGNDLVKGGKNNDILMGNGGNDVVKGKKGDDILLYSLSHNETGSYDKYKEGKGDDTLNLGFNL